MPATWPLADALGEAPRRTVTGGVDTRKDLHVAAVVDTVGADRHRIVSATRTGYRALLRWMCSHGYIRLVGVVGTGSDGMA